MEHLIINLLGDYPTCSKSACIPREKQTPNVSFRPGTGTDQPPPLHPPRKYHTTLEVQSNKYDGLLKGAEIGCHSGHKDLLRILTVVLMCIFVLIVSLPNYLQPEVSIMFPSAHACPNLRLSFGVTNSVRQKVAGPLALVEILTLV
jgi:hypothetical protein